MKKLDRKGFTLVELLAVIVILAIVVGITLVTLLPTLKDSRQKAFEITAQTAADFLEDQYELANLGKPTLVTIYKDVARKIPDEDYAKAGLKKENYTGGTWYITSSGRACVYLIADTENGDFVNVTNPAVSSGC